MTQKTPRRRLNLNMSGSSNDSNCMEVEFLSGTCENLAPAGMDGRESTRVRTPSNSKNSKRFRSASSPFASPSGSPNIDGCITESMDPPLSPLIGSPSLHGVKRCFKVIRKRRATLQDFGSNRCGLKSSSPIRKTPKRSEFIRPKNNLNEQDYVLQEDNLVSSPDCDDPIFTQLGSAPIVASIPMVDLIKRRPTNLPGNDRRPSALMRKRDLGESPVSYRTKRCLSLCSPSMINARDGFRDRNLIGSRGIRERNRSVNDYNIPQKDLNPALMDQQDLTGDFKRMLSLPTTTSGKHQDLKYIDGSTLVKLRNGEVNRNGSVIDTTIVDARYPYEFKGGHIKGAVNLFNPEMIEKHFYQNLENKENSQIPGRVRVVVFHCEFSSERAPAMLRCLRKLDRQRNRYPTLDFPELYLLKDGYKEFFEREKSSTTGSYLPMLDGKHTQELRHFRKKCKTLPNSKM
jgi:hypothetical protein